MAVPEVDMKLLEELQAMGFPLNRATRALHYCGNSSLEDAINWVVDHETDPDIDEMPLIPVNIEVQASEPPSMTEQLRLKAQELRDRAQRRTGIGEKKSDREKVYGPLPKAVKLPVKFTTKAELMSECLRSLRRKNKHDEAGVKKAFQTLLYYIGNVTKDPDEERFRRIRLSNPGFVDRVGRFKEGVDFLELCGFERIEGDKFLYLPRDKFEAETLRSAGAQLESAITNPFFGLISS